MSNLMFNIFKQKLMNKRVAIMCMIALLLFSCSIDDDCIMEANNLKGKLKSFRFLGLDTFSQTYFYNTLTGQLDSIVFESGNSNGIANISINNEFVYWANYNQTLYEIELNNRMPTLISTLDSNIGIGYGGVYSWYFAYDENNKLDTIIINMNYELDYTYTSSKLYGFASLTGESKSYYSYKRGNEYFTDTFNITYSEIEYTGPIPFQYPFQSNGNYAHLPFLEISFSPIHFMELIGIRVFDNDNLVSRNGDVVYSYQFNNEGKVESMLMDGVIVIGGTNNQALSEFEYY